MENKKAQGMSITTIILIILGLVVLVVLILGFTMGWSNIKDWIIPSNNVDSIADKCNIACATGSTYDYCTTLRTITIDGNDETPASCKVLSATASYGIDTVDKCVSVTC